MHELMFQTKLEYILTPKYCVTFSGLAMPAMTRRATTVKKFPAALPGTPVRVTQTAW